MLGSIKVEDNKFQSINRAYNAVFRPNCLTLGLVVPIEAYPSTATPTMVQHIERVKSAEILGFSAVWLRDVPFNVPSFGDAGQTFDPFVYLGLLAGQTERIALGVASLILPLRHPAHVAKATATVDVISGGRVILGVASGDRPQEYPALNQPFHERASRFRESFKYIRQMSDYAPEFENTYGSPYGGMDMLPKPSGSKLPLLVTGSSRQSPDWLAQHGDGWITYPRPITAQAAIIHDWRQRMAAFGRPDQPAMQSLYIDLVDDPQAAPQPIHLGYRLGIDHLQAYLKSLEQIGVNHVALNLRFNRSDIETTINRLAEKLFPDFS